MIDTEIRAAIADYAAGTVDMDELEASIASISWCEGPSDTGSLLAAEVTNVLAELDLGALTEAQAHDMLVRLAAPWIAGRPTVSVSTGSVTRTLAAQVTGWAVAGTPTAEALG